MLLNTLISICGAIIGISAILTSLVWLKYRHNLIKQLLFFWLSGILSFLAQGIFNNLEVSGFISFGTNWVTIIFFLKIFSDGIELDLPFKTYNKVIGFSLLLGSICLLKGATYQVSSSIFCIACAGVVLHGATRHLRNKKNDFLSNGYRFLLVFDAIHFLDYPFVRANIDLAVIGFSITLVFFFCFATYVPVFILRKISSDYTGKLQQEVATRTRQLDESNFQLTVAFENLKASNAQVEVLLRDNQLRLSSLVHDVSNPLQIIFYSFSMMVTDTEKFISQLSQKSDRIQRAIDTVGQILAEAKATHSVVLGKKSVTLSIISIDQIVSDLVFSFEDKVTSKSLAIDVDLVNLSNTQVLGNEAWLKNQVLSNLLSNAIKFSHPGSKIVIRGSISEHDKVSICVINNGVGISKEKIGKIFEFDKLTTSIGTMGEVGTGLGLPIVKQYTELMGGEISVKTLGFGETCFEVLLSKVAA